MKPIEQFRVHPLVHWPLLPPFQLLQHLECLLRPPSPAHLLQQSPVGDHIRLPLTIQHIQQHPS
uniref:Uncharacterized protein n=1 Tax=Arundo donax TaxID=35708 RepID=A0A0A9FWE3_ARUDO